MRPIILEKSKSTITSFMDHKKLLALGISIATILVAIIVLIGLTALTDLIYHTSDAANKRSIMPQYTHSTRFEITNENPIIHIKPEVIDSFMFKG
jgi:hypothetical protein